MKDKLEVGMYVRTKKGIAKIIDRILEPDHYYFKMWITDKFLEINDDTEYISEVDVIKASYNIIDLIEKNDYINGSWVNKIVDGKPIHEDYNDPFYSFGWENDDIKTVITHEQIEQMEYKVSD